MCDGKLELVRAVVKELNPTKGFDLLLHSDAPPGTGLGLSSTLTTALIGTFKEWFNIPLTDYQLAELSYRLERVEVGIQGESRISMLQCLVV